MVSGTGCGSLTNENVTALQPGGHIADAVHHRIGGLFNTKTAMTADDLNERGGRGVYNDRCDVQISGQLF